jgi:membrane protease YdiL (CAAX protease family)
VSPDFRPAIIDSNDKAGILMRAIGLSVIFAFFEEIGWTGFAVPQLRSRLGVLTTGLTVGVVCGAWHFPLFWEEDTFSGTLPFSILLMRLFSWLPALRVLMVWIHDRTKSLPVVMVMHAAIVVNQLTLFPEALAGERLLIHIIVFAVTMWVMVAAVAMARGTALSRTVPAGWVTCIARLGDVFDGCSRKAAHAVGRTHSLRPGHDR